MKCKYDLKIALALVLRMKRGESISKLSKETGIPKVTLWRWKTGKSFPHKKLYKDNHDFYIKNRERILKKAKERRLNGNWVKVLKRDNYRCVVCPTFHHVEVHHIDGNQKNNNLSNLVTLCLMCHRSIHRVARLESLQFLVNKLQK